MGNAMNLSEQAQVILDIAEQYGAEQNFLFITTFKRYQVQINILTKLEKIVREEGTLVEKEYVKGRKNIYTHPAVNDYNKTADSANRTVTTLMKIILQMRDGADPNSAPDELMEFFSMRKKKN